MFNSLAFFHFAALEHLLRDSWRATAGPLQWKCFSIFSLRDAHSVIDAVEGGIGGSLSEAKTYGSEPWFSP